MVNGQVWSAESSYRARNFFKPDTNIRIEQAPLSGYQMIALDKNQKIQTVFVRISPIMETLTGFMIAGFIIFSGKLIASGELAVNNFFSFLAAMMLAYQPIRSLATINMVAYQGAAAFKRISNIIDKEIDIKEMNKTIIPALVGMSGFSNLYISFTT